MSEQKWVGPMFSIRTLGGNSGYDLVGGRDPSGYYLVGGAGYDFVGYN